MRPIMRYAGSALLLLLTLAGVAQAETTPAAVPVPTLPVHGDQGPAADGAVQPDSAAADWCAVAAREGLYFKLESVIARDYLALLPDGTYQFVACSDFSAWETDTGKWQFSDGSGGVLVSAWQTEVDYADIDGGFFTVRVASRQDFLRLPELRSGLEQFLQTKSGNHFKFSENPGLADWLGIVPVPGRDQFTRAEVNAGIAALDRALAGARPLIMPFRICSEGEFTYVISSDTGERSLLLMNEARARDRIRRYGRGHMVPARITRTEFRNMRKEPAAAPE